MCTLVELLYLILFHKLSKNCFQMKKSKYKKNVFKTNTPNKPTLWKFIITLSIIFI